MMVTTATTPIGKTATAIVKNNNRTRASLTGWRLSSAVAFGVFAWRRFAAPRPRFFAMLIVYPLSHGDSYFHAISATRSSISQSFVVSPAAIAGVTRVVW